MAQQRDFPYIWATWLPRLLTGENSCEWAIWFKAHHQNWERPPSDFEQTKWLIDHTALLNHQRQEWAERGHTVYVEHQNRFRLQGKTATLAGQPDLIVIRRQDILIIDVKTGREQPSHRAQLMIYMYAMPKTPSQFRDARIAGEIVYPTHIGRVPKGGVDQGFIHRMGALIRRAAGDKPPPRVPSTQECRFCDIGPADCPERVDVDLEPLEGTTEDF